MFTDEQSWLNAVNTNTVVQTTPTANTLDPFADTDIRGSIDLGYNQQNEFFGEVRDSDHSKGELSFSFDLASGLDAIGFSAIRSIDTKTGQLGDKFDIGEVGISVNGSALYSLEQLLSGSVMTINPLIDLSVNDSVDSNQTVDFIGFVSSSGIQSVTFGHADPIDENVEDFRIERIQTAKVSTPSIAALLGFALAFMAYRKLN